MNIPENKKQNIFWITVTAAAVIQTVVLFFYCQNIKGKVPVHYNIAMKPDRWGSPYELVVLSAITPILFLLRPLISKKYGQEPQNIKLQNGIILFSGSFIAALSWCNTALALMPDNTRNRYVAKCIPVIILVPLALSAIVFGNYEGTIKPNNTLGIRIKWTLADENNWRRTHRLAGILSVTAGLFLLVCSLAGLTEKQPLFYVAGICVLIVLEAVIPVWYSRHISKKNC
jgi:uncharacterized membrane protein